MLSYLARVASVDGAVDAFVIVAAPAEVRSRWVVDATGTGFVAVDATRFAGAVEVVAARCGATVVVTGVADVVAGSGFVTFGGETPAFRLVGVAAPRGTPDVVTICGFATAPEVVRVCVAAGGGTPALRFCAIAAEVVAACVFVIVAGTIGFATTAGAGVAAWRFCHQLQPPYAPAATRSRRRSGVSMLVLRGSGGGTSAVSVEVGTASSACSGTAARRAASICASSKPHCGS